MIMKYPKMEEVERANHLELCRWYRFLPSPGSSAVARDDFDVVMEAEIKVMDRLIQRVKDFGGFTPEISKQLGWGNHE